MEGRGEGSREVNVAVGREGQTGARVGRRQQRQAGAKGRVLSFSLRAKGQTWLLNHGSFRAQRTDSR